MKKDKMFRGIGAKLTIAFLSVTLTIVVVGIFTYINTRRVLELTTTANERVQLVRDAARDVREAALQELVALEQVHRRDYARAVEDFRDARQTMMSALEHLRKKALIDAVDLDSLLNHENAFTLLAERMFSVQEKLASTNAAIQRRAGISQLSAAHNELMSSLDQETQRLRNFLVRLEWRADQLTTEQRVLIETAMTNVQISHVILFILSISVTALVGVLVKRKVAFPMRKLADEVAMLGSGNLDRHLEAKGIDEVRILEDSIVRMQAELRKSIDQHTILQMEMMEEQKLAAVGRLSQAIAHHLNSPLATISLAVDRLKTTRQCSTEVAIVKSCANEMQMLIGTLLHLAPQGLSTFQQPINLNTLIVNELRFILVDDNARYALGRVIHLDPNLPSVNGVYSHFSQSIMNVVQNAIDAMYSSASQTLAISTRFDEQCVYVDVEDTGCGILPENVPKLFTPFYTTKPRRSVRSNGTPTGIGLGLWCSAELLKPYRGEIDVASQPGVGSRFTIKVPYKTQTGDGV